MPVTPTYPGIYIEEIRSTSRTITAAATSITVFVGYTHPFKTKHFNEAVRIFNFTEYEREFGGFYTSGVFDNNVALAVNQFFLNGGSDAYVVGLEAKYYDVNKNSSKPTDPIINSKDINGILFSPLEPTDKIPIKIKIKHAPSIPTQKLGDITITYGSQVETFRGVKFFDQLKDLDKVKKDPDFIYNRINGVSSLVKLKLVNEVNYPTILVPAETDLEIDKPNVDIFTTFKEDDFTKVFEVDRSLDKVPIFNLLVIPGIVSNSIWSAALAFCERKQAFAILDSPIEAAADTSSDPLPLIGELIEDGSAIPKSTNGALYFPYLKSTDPITGDSIELPPSGFVAGIYAKTDLNRGVWKAPAGLETTILNTTGVVERGRMTDQRQGVLNPLGVNCLRNFPGIGTVVFGARTLVTNNPAYQEFRYVPVRRITLFIEQTLYRNLGWVVFEPNDEPLWSAIRLSIENFMLSLFSQGAFQGSTPGQAFRVKCDKSTTTQTDIDNGVVNIIVAFAPLKPAEFVIVKIAQLAGQVQS